MSVIGAAPVRTRSTPGTRVTIGDPGLKPSLPFHPAGSIATPAALRGIDSVWRSTRRPVAVVASATVKKSLGNGSRQAAGSIGSHRGPSTCAEATDPGSEPAPKTSARNATSTPTPGPRHLPPRVIKVAQANDYGAALPGELDKIGAGEANDVPCNACRKAIEHRSRGAVAVP